MGTQATRPQLTGGGPSPGSGSRATADDSPISLTVHGLPRSRHRTPGPGGPRHAVRRRLRRRRRRRPVARGAAQRRPRRIGARHPQRHPGHGRRPRGGHGARRGRPGRHRPRQRRRRRRHPQGRDGGQRPAVEHPLGRRARRRPADLPGPQRPAGRRRPEGGELAALEVGGRRASRQDAGHRRARPGRRAGGPAGAGLRDAPGRLRPVRERRAGPADGRRPAADGGRGGRPVRLPHHPPAPHPRDHGADRPGPAGPGQAGDPHRQHRPGRDRRRGGALRRHRVGPGGRRRPSTCSPRSRRRRARCSSWTRWS